MGATVLLGPSAGAQSWVPTRKDNMVLAGFGVQTRPAGGVQSAWLRARGRRGGQAGGKSRAQTAGLTLGLYAVPWRGRLSGERRTCCENGVEVLWGSFRFQA